MQLLLPSELKHRIVELSPHDSLAALARTHTTYRREAEQALYRTLSNPCFYCLETLATNSEKAGFVRFLTVECAYYEHNYPWQQWRAISYLLNALVNTHSLSDFRLRMPRRYEVQPWMGGDESLDKILWSVYELIGFNLLKFNSGNTVILRVIFDYKPFIAMNLATFLKSSGVKPNCRYLEYTASTIKSSS